MASDQSEERKFIERLRKRSNSKWWIPNVVGLSAVFLGMSAFLAWMAERGRAGIEIPVVWRAVIQARVECLAEIFAFMTGISIGLIVLVYYVRKKHRLLVSMWDRLEALEKAGK